MRRPRPAFCRRPWRSPRHAAICRRSAFCRARGPRYLSSVSSITDAARSQARAISKNVARSVSSLVLRANWMHSRACPLYFCDKVIERPSAHEFSICRIAKVKKPSVNPRGNATTVPMKKLAMSESPNRNHPPAAPMLASGLGRDCDLDVRQLTQRSLRFGSWLTPGIDRSLNYASRPFLQKLRSSA